MSRDRILAALTALALLPAPAEAQTCMRGRPAPLCRSFAVTELGYSYRLGLGASPDAGEQQDHYLNGDFGWMWNRSPRTAIGGTLFAGALVDFAFSMRVGAKARVRRWLGEGVGLDLSAGPVVGSASPSSGTVLGLTSHVGLTLEDRLVLLAGLDVLPDPTGPDAVWSVGARLGSRPALWGGGLAMVLLGAAAIALAQ